MGEKRNKAKMQHQQKTLGDGKKTPDKKSDPGDKTSDPTLKLAKNFNEMKLEHVETGDKSDQLENNKQSTKVTEKSTAKQEADAKPVSENNKQVTSEDNKTDDDQKKVKADREAKKAAKAAAKAAAANKKKNDVKLQEPTEDKDHKPNAIPDTVHPDPKPNANNQNAEPKVVTETPAKSKAELKAERRAKQEAQRAAKAQSQK